LLKYFISTLCISCALSAAEIEGISQPSADVALSFVRPGKVIDVQIKVGDKVVKGQLLSIIDGELEKNKIAQLNAELTNDVKERAEKAKMKQKENDIADFEKALKEGAGTEKEVANAKLELSQMKFTVESLQFEKLQIAKRIIEQELILKQSSLVSPISGRVEKLDLETGESVERLKEVVKLVSVDPLWVDVNIPLSYCQGLLVGRDVEVLFPKFGKAKEVLKKGKIIFRSSVADPGSETLKFRIEVANPEDRLAGERVKVQIPGE
jgi:membrane fusion protein, multidrug efflux system